MGGRQDEEDRADTFALHTFSVFQIACLICALCIAHNLNATVADAILP
jgi:hypothetical protein